MSSSRKIAILSEVASGHPSMRTQAFFQSETVGAFYDYVIGKFLEKEKAGKITRAELARRMRKDPAVITRLLSRPSNITLSTLSDLLLAIGGERPVPHSEPILQNKPTEFPSWLWEPQRQEANLPPSPLGSGPRPNASTQEKSSQGKIGITNALA